MVEKVRMFYIPGGVESLFETPDGACTPDHPLATGLSQLCDVGLNDIQHFVKQSGVASIP